MSCARVTSLIPVTMSASAKTASGNDAGLKMWTRRPSRSQRISSLAAKPMATSRNWKWNQSSVNQRNRLMLKMTGTGPKPSRCASRRDQPSSRSNP